MTQALMNHGVCIYEDNGKFIVKKIPTSLDPRIEITQEDQEDKTMVCYDTYEQAVDFAQKFIGETAETTEITDKKEKVVCKVILGYRPLGGRLQIANLEDIEAISEEEARLTAEEVVNRWFKTHQDIWDLVKTPENSPKNYEIIVKPK